MKKFWEDLKILARAEGRIWHNRKVWLAVGVIALVPLLYCVIFLTSILDPYGHLQDLPAALVSEDEGATYEGTSYRLGKDIVDTLLEQKPVAFRQYPSQRAAEQAVADGLVYFSITVPADFSRRALAARASEPAQLKLHSSPGTNFVASRIGQTLVQQVALSVNRQLAERRWSRVGQLLPQVGQGFGDVKAALAQALKGAEAVDAGASRLAQGAQQLAQGAAQAAQGSQALAEGARSVAGGVGQLTSGTAQLGAGLRTLDQAAPSATTLAPLLQGSRDLAQGAQQLSTGNAKLATAVGSQWLAPAELKEGTKQLSDGAVQLARGTNDLSGGVQTLVEGNGRIKQALDTMASKLPSDGDLNRLSTGAQTVSEKTGELSTGLGSLAAGATSLATGTQSLQQGSDQLAAGLKTLHDRIPTSAPELPGDPAGLANGVQVDETTTAVLPNNGTGFAPYFMPISLWIGMLISTFIFPYLLIPESGRQSSQLSRLLPKLVAPGLLSAAQATLVTVGVLALGIPYDHFWQVLVTNILSGWTFLAVILALVVVLGDAGRLVAVIILVLQIGAAGGSFPIELSPSFFQAVHPWLPMSDTVHALRYAISGALAPEFLGSLNRLALTLVGALAVAMLGRSRWQVVPDTEMRSALSL